MSNLSDMRPTKEARHFCAGPFTCHARFSTPRRRPDASALYQFTGQALFDERNGFADAVNGNEAAETRSLRLA